MEPLKIKRLDVRAKIPLRGTPQSAGVDLYALLDEPVTIPPHEIRKIPTGLAFAIPEGSAGFIFARSGLGVKHGIVPANCVGVIDSDYRGEVMVGLINHLDAPFTVEPEDRIAQLVLLPVLTPEMVEVDILPDTVRGKGGFGSTGR